MDTQPLIKRLQFVAMRSYFYGKIDSLAVSGRIEKAKKVSALVEQMGYGKAKICRVK